MNFQALLLLVICVYQIGAPVRSYPVESMDHSNIRISTEVAAKRLALLREQMILYEVDAYIITTSDVHQTAYLADRDKRSSWISGFTGSAGTAVVTLENAALWTDSRYYEQAVEQLSHDWILMRSGLSTTPTLQIWLTTVLSANARVGVDPEITTYSEWTSWNTVLGISNVSLVALDDNLIDIIWEHQPGYPSGLVFEHPIEFAGLQFRQTYRNHGRRSANIFNSWKSRGCTPANFNEDAEHVQLSVVNQSVEHTRKPSRIMLLFATANRYSRR